MCIRDSSAPLCIKGYRSPRNPDGSTERACLVGEQLTSSSAQQSARALDTRMETSCSLRLLGPVSRQRLSTSSNRFRESKFDFIALITGSKPTRRLCIAWCEVSTHMILHG